MRDEKRRKRIPGRRDRADLTAAERIELRQLRKKVAEQKEQLGLAMFDAERVGAVAKAGAASATAGPTTAASLATPEQ